MQVAVLHISCDANSTMLVIYILLLHGVLLHCSGCTHLVLVLRHLMHNVVEPACSQQASYHNISCSVGALAAAAMQECVSQKQSKDY